jgi:proton-dependent oligopeptide transporter, POT family
MPNAHVKSTVQHETLFGHPVGLYTLFFAEMWERFSFYGMRALLILYMTKGFLGYSDDRANGVYSAYIAFVYATGFLGGMLADRLLGTRRSIIFGGLLMAAGHLMMTLPQTDTFYLALGLLITGNGFFKPNISTTVGSLYPPGSPRKDGGFTIFYMGINLGAALAPLICAYVGERFGREYGFGLATVGMLIGLAVFVMPIRITQILILGGALATSISMLFLQNNIYSLVINTFTGLALAAAGIIAFIALGRGGLPEAAGAPPDPDLLRRKFGPFRLDVLVYVGTLLSVGLFAMLLQRNSIASYCLYGAGLIALVYMIFEALRRSKVERERMFVIIILTFFSIVFWASFEQAGSSMQFFEDRNLDRVVEQTRLTEAEVGTQIRFRVAIGAKDAELKTLPLLTQEQVGRENDNPEMAKQIAEAMRLVNEERPLEKRLSAEKLDDFIRRTTKSNALLLTGLDALRDAALLKDAPASLQTLDWKVGSSNVGMGVGGSEIASPTFQAANPIYIMIFGLVFTALWTVMASRGIEPSVPVKFSLALLQLGLGFGVMWYGAQYASDARGMVALPWLLLGILLHTTGELCTSPIGLSMVSNLSPKLLVSTVMGAWWLGMAIANKLSGLVANLTGLGGEEGGGQQVIPLPIDTVHTYGKVFGQIAIVAFIAAFICLCISPLLTKWMHPEAKPE